MPLRIATVIVAALVATAAHAADPVVRILDLQIGLPPARFGDDASPAVPVAKAETWVPVRFRLDPPSTDRPLFVELESTDGDKHATVVRWPLANGHVPLVKVGGPASGVSARIGVEGANGEFTPVSEAVSSGPLPTRPAATFTVVSLGSTLPGFRLKTGERDAGGQGLRGGRVESSAFTSVEALPDHWYGYDAADLVILATASTPDDFLKALFDDRHAGKREALMEWVRRGGKLAVSANRKAASLGAGFLPVSITDGPPAEQADIASVTGGAGGLSLVLRNPRKKQIGPDGREVRDDDGKPVLAPVEPVRVAALKAEKTPLRTVATANGKVPAVVHVAVGMGRVTIIGFDPDASPMLDLDGDRRAAAWAWLLRAAASEKAAEEPGKAEGADAATAAEEGVLAGLRGHVDKFEGVPVISFGWVALVLVLYAAVVGPLEYVVLKRVFGRPELTWLTLPLIAAAVCGGAYWAAHAAKGNDLRINKVDVVDVDVAGGRVYGRTWFSVFTPKTETYSLAVEPGNELGNTLFGKPQPETLLDWMSGAKVDEGVGLAGRGYRYRLDGQGTNGLDGLTVPIWSTKTLTANWSTENVALAVRSEFHRQPDAPNEPGFVTGRFALPFPMPGVTEVAVVYAGEVYRYEPASPGQSFAFDSRNEAAKSQGTAWRRREFALDPRFYGLPAVADPASVMESALPLTPTPVNPWGALFHEELLRSGVAGANRGLQNAGLRSLDQSWRLDKANKDEVIVLLRIPPAAGRATGATPTVVKSRANPGAAWGDLDGIVQQETVVRVFIPFDLAR